MQNAKSYRFILGLILPLLLFQNCGGPSRFETLQPPFDKATPDHPTSEYTKVIYDLNLEGYHPSSDGRLEVDLQTGQMEIRKNGKTSKCAVDKDRISALDSVMASGQICYPAPLPPGTAVCMAIGISDIELANENSAIRLRHNVCHSGVFLCGEDDAKLRSILKDLLANPPAHCS